MESIILLGILNLLVFISLLIYFGIKNKETRDYS